MIARKQTMRHSLLAIGVLATISACQAAPPSALDTSGKALNQSLGAAGSATPSASDKSGYSTAKSKTVAHPIRRNHETSLTDIQQ
jgi:hypothetical protein